MDRETISRCFINILDIKHYYDYAIFMNDDLYIQLKNYIAKITSDEKEIQEYYSVLEKNKKIIDRIAENKDISINEYNTIMEDLRLFRKKYIQLDI